MWSPILAPRALDRFRAALTDFTVDGVRDLLGPVGDSALTRGDLTGVSCALPPGDRLSTLVRLFLLGEVVSAADAAHALAPLPLPDAAGLIATDGDTVRAEIEVRPYGEANSPAPWWVTSDFGSDVRPGPLRPDHVLGIGAASLSLAQATIRTPVGSALDVGTGCGVQALHLGSHAERVTATDLSERALRLAATTAALSGQEWTLRQGSLLDPVAGTQFDQVVANPPFVVSPGFDSAHSGYDYRDSGLPGDGVCAHLVRGIPALLAPEGTASLLANWVITADQPWEDRLAGWVAGSGCDAWVWQREVAEPGEYVALWLRDAGEQPGTPRWTSRYTEWLDWFAAAGVLAVGMGLVTLWRTGSADPIVVCEDVRQPVEQPVGAALSRWIGRQRWLRARDDRALLTARLRCADGVVRTRADLRGDGGWETKRTTLRQSYGLREEVESDSEIAGLVAACDGSTTLGTLIEVLAAALGTEGARLAASALPVVRDLVGRGFLEPS